MLSMQVVLPMGVEAESAGNLSDSAKRRDSIQRAKAVPMRGFVQSTCEVSVISYPYVPMYVAKTFFFESWDTDRWL